MICCALVLGLGISGQAAAQFLLHQGYRVIGVDDQLETEVLSDLIGKGMAFASAHEIAWSQIQMLVVSPGVSPTHPVYGEALQRKIPVIGEAELALRHVDQPVIGITGTNGKTTVTLLVEHILNNSGIQAKALGNMGDPLTLFLLNPIPDAVLVVELSSYQLETMSTAVLDAAVILNITPDHLDRYASMEAYARAKCHLQHLMKKGCETRFFVSEQVVRAFGHLLQPGYEIYTQSESKVGIWQSWRPGFGPGFSRRRSSACEYTGAMQSGPKTGMPAKPKPTFESRGVYTNIETILPLQYRELGKHDRENALAAWALCQPFGVTHEQFYRGLETFKKPRHRIEFVADVNGVSFFDDSKGTNIDAVIQAVNAMKGSVILIAGGVDKGASYLPWKEAFGHRVKRMIVMGEAAPKIYEELKSFFEIEIVDSLSSAVEKSYAFAVPGDSILLSPGCSSFDMFRDYVHRGEEFQKKVLSMRRKRI